MQRSLKLFAVATTIGMLLVLTGGELVTKTGSGMGCGRTWPLCNGQVLQTHMTPELMIELAHRVVSGVVGLMVLILSVWSWKKVGYIKETKFLSFLSFFFLVLQALIGAAAVMWGQSGFILALHFGISLISFSAVFLLTLLIFETDKKLGTNQLFIDKRMGHNILYLSIYCYLVIYSGALVRHTNSSLVCRDWPLCLNNSTVFPQNLYEWIQMGHRFAAGILFLWIGYLMILSIRHYRQQKILCRGLVTAFCLVVLQVTAGALIIFSKLNLYITLFHALFITCLFGILSYFLLLYTRSPKDKVAG